MFVAIYSCSLPYIYVGVHEIYVGSQYKYLFKIFMKGLETGIVNW